MTVRQQASGYTPHWLQYEGKSMVYEMKERRVDVGEVWQAV
jgi:hypothetical protein